MSEEKPFEAFRGINVKAAGQDFDLADLLDAIPGDTVVLNKSVLVKISERIAKISGELLASHGTWGG